MTHPVKVTFTDSEYDKLVKPKMALSGIGAASIIKQTYLNNQQNHTISVNVNGYRYLLANQIAVIEGRFKNIY